MSVMTSLRDLLRAPDPVDLAGIDPRSTPGLPDGWCKRMAAKQLEKLGAELAQLQTRLYAATRGEADRRRLLVVLQAMDAGGKDGLVRAVGGAFNPTGLQVTSFKAPTDEERRQHFLWRIERALPPAGYVGIFNRSHYEDVLIVRVKELVPAEVWQGRYAEINVFERDLVADGVILVKIMLHISAAEQKERLLARLRDPEKYWKYNPRDLVERARWVDYQEAYAAAINRCSEAAPWYVVPADRKWYRNWAVAGLLREVLRAENLTYPGPDFDLDAERARVEAS